MSEDAFLPDDFKGIPGGGAYLKFVQGDNRFRILSRPVIGWEYWTDVEGKRKPIRVKEFGEMPREAQVAKDKDRPKYFWAMAVYNYGAQEVQILSITQKGILTALQTLIDDPDWGTPLNYDLNVKKTGEGLETEYQTNPKPKKELDPEIKALFDDAGIDLQAWFAGDDPFKGTHPSTENLEGVTEEELDDIADKLDKKVK